MCRKVRGTRWLLLPPRAIIRGAPSACVPHTSPSDVQSLGRFSFQEAGGLMICTSSSGMGPGPENACSTVTPEAQVMNEAQAVRGIVQRPRVAARGAKPQLEHAHRGGSVACAHLDGWWTSRIWRTLEDSRDLGERHEAAAAFPSMTNAWRDTREVGGERGPAHKRACRAFTASGKPRGPESATDTPLNRPGCAR